MSYYLLSIFSSIGPFQTTDHHRALPQPPSAAPSVHLSPTPTAHTLTKPQFPISDKDNEESMIKLQPLRALARALTSNFCTAAADSTSQFPLKNVTRSNFEPALAELKRHVKAADFVSIDLEMTGVTSAPWREAFEFDRFDVRYLKTKDSAEKFAVVQFGVCPFRWDSQKQSLIAHPYNFYVFPRQEIEVDGRSYEFLCQTSSLEFLAKYQFDFNACIKEGISYLSREQEEEVLKKDILHGESEMKIKSATGFRHVIDLLSSERKLIVGHNCFLDFAHIYHKFIRPLPPTVEEFVSCLHSSFPHVIDTKVLLNADGYLQYMMSKGGTSLARAFAKFCPQMTLDPTNVSSEIQSRVKVEVQVDQLSSSNWNSGAKHEAGYDAFMTGSIFAQACSHLGVNFSEHSSTTSMAHQQSLKKHINLLYLTWTSGDIINLCTREITKEFSISRKRKFPGVVFPNIIVLWGFSPTLKARDITSCIAKALGRTSVTSVYQLDDSALFVQFSNSKLVSEFLTLKDTLEKTSDDVSALHPLSTLLNGGKTCAAGYELYKEICSQPFSKLLFADQAKALGFNWKTKLHENESHTGDAEMEESESVVADKTDVDTGKCLTDRWMESYQASLQDDTTAFGCDLCKLSVSA